ncbi:MAG: hypothetical protein MCS20_01885 [Candidatus Phytoplasma mali]|nr:hypothetical protein [Candidatus Phytoplasma mali]
MCNFPNFEAIYTFITIKHANELYIYIYIYISLSNINMTILHTCYYAYI